MQGTIPVFLMTTSCVCCAYHAKGINCAHGSNSLIHSKEDHINVEHDGSHNDQNIQIRTGEFHYPGWDAWRGWWGGKKREEREKEEVVWLRWVKKRECVYFNPSSPAFCIKLLLYNTRLIALQCCLLCIIRMIAHFFSLKYRLMARKTRANTMPTNDKMVYTMKRARLM